CKCLQRIFPKAVDPGFRLASQSRKAKSSSKRQNGQSQLTANPKASVYETIR
ncbi:unnamed protein product, partial [Allacma fusca]